MANIWTLALSSIGGIVVFRALYSVIGFIRLHFFLPAQSLRSYKRNGPETTYALVTGASAGIGLGTAQELVNQGFGVVLLGHLADELAAAKRYLERSTPGAKVRIVVMDAITATGEDQERMVQSLANLHITILVNNVGGGNSIAPPSMRPAVSYTISDIDRIVSHNARFMAHLTPLMLRAFTSRAETRCLILNISSGSHSGFPWVSLYSAAKAFVLAFSTAIAREAGADPATRHIDCLAVIPGDVRTQQNHVGLEGSPPSWDEYGRCLVRTADNAVAAGTRSFSPYWVHDLQLRVLPWIPEGLFTKEMVKLMGRKRRAYEAVAGVKKSE